MPNSIKMYAIKKLPAERRQKGSESLGFIMPVLLYAPRKTAHQRQPSSSHRLEA